MYLEGAEVEEKRGCCGCVLSPWCCFWVMWDCFQSSWMLHCSPVYGAIIPLWQPHCKPVEHIKPCSAQLEEQSKYFWGKKKKQKKKKQVYTSVSSSLSLSLCLSFPIALFLFLISPLIFTTCYLTHIGPQPQSTAFRGQDNSSPYEELLNP